VAAAAAGAWAAAAAPAAGEEPVGGSSFTAGSMPLPSASDGIRGVLGPAGTYGGYGSTCTAPQAAAGGILSDTGAWHSNGKQAGGAGIASAHPLHLPATSDAGRLAEIAGIGQLGPLLFVNLAI
jgi:hypothetical protein